VLGTVLMITIRSRNETLHSSSVCIVPLLVHCISDHSLCSTISLWTMSLSNGIYWRVSELRSYFILCALCRRPIISCIRRPLRALRRGPPITLRAYPWLLYLPLSRYAIDLLYLLHLLILSLIIGAESLLCLLMPICYIRSDSAYRCSFLLISSCLLVLCLETSSHIASDMRSLAADSYPINLSRFWSFLVSDGADELPAVSSAWHSLTPASLGCLARTSYHIS